MEQDPINQLDSDSTPKPTPKKTRKRKVVIVGEDSLKSLIETKVSSEDVVVCVPNSDIAKETIEAVEENPHINPELKIGLVEAIRHQEVTTPPIPREELVKLSVENFLPAETKAETKAEIKAELESKIKAELDSKITIKPTVKPALSEQEEAKLYFQSLAKRIEYNRAKRYDEELWDYLEKNRRTIGEECALIEAGKSALCKRLRDYALTKYEKKK